MSRGFGDLTRGWLRGWTPWIVALVGAAMFAAAMSGMAYVRHTYEPQVDYSAMNEAELDAAKADMSSPPAAPAPKKDRAKKPAATRPDPAPSIAPRTARPKEATPYADSAGPSESAGSAEPSESAGGPLAGLEALFSRGVRH